MPKKKSQPAPEYKIYMTYSEDREGGKKCEGQENDEWADHEPVYIIFNPIDLFIEAPSWSETIHIPFDPEEHIDQKIYVVVVRYQSGNTFGQSYGNWCMVGAYSTEQEAVDVDEAIRDKKYKGYKPWEGYFERFENVEIHSFNLQRAAPVQRKKSSTKVIKHY